MTLIADIKVGDRHRKDLGDIAALAESIKTEGLLQPIGITEGNELVFGHRRLCACRDHLGWTEIDARIVKVTSIVAGEYAENEMRKDFTVSERVAILETIKQLPGTNRFTSGKDISRYNKEQAAILSGLGNATTAREATVIVARGIPELVAAVDRGNIAIEPAFAIALQPAEHQAEIVKLPTPERRVAVRQLDRPGKNPGEGSRKRLNGSAPPPPKPNEAALKREQMLLNRPILKPVNNGRPKGAEALEQAPGYPPGMTKGMVWTETYGRVETRTHEEVARAKLYDRLIEFNALIRKIVSADAWPTYDDLATLDTRRRNNMLHEWSKHRVALYAVLDAAIGHPKMSEQRPNDELAS